jgi:hypothetical protein
VLLSTALTTPTVTTASATATATALTPPTTLKTAL